jgi:hypothetical protein
MRTIDYIQSTYCTVEVSTAPDNNSVVKSDKWTVHYSAASADNQPTDEFCHALYRSVPYNQTE